jgi:hypothetical protein
MKDVRYLEIKDLVQQFDKLSDDAFVAAMADAGVTASDLKSYAREAEKREKAVRSARRSRR